MGKATGFMEFKREKPAERDPLTRINDWNEYSSPFLRKHQKDRERAAWTAAPPFVKSAWI